MYALKLRVDDFVRRAPILSDNLTDNLRERFKLTFGAYPSESEINSWRRSLPALAKTLASAPSGVREAVIYLEFGMPGSNCRADVVLVGLDKDMRRSAVVIELKQWDPASIAVSGFNVRVGPQVHPHPSDQASGYRDYLADLSPAFSDVNATVRSCAYLHNAASSSLGHLTSAPFNKLVQLSPLFGADQHDEMNTWLATTLASAPDSLFLSDLESNRIRVSRNLFDSVATAVRDEPIWTLLDEQQVAFNQIMGLIRENDGEKHLVLVSGGPGTGKSVIAMQVMGELSRRHIPTVHVTNSSSFTTVMRSLIQQKRSKQWGTTAVNGLFRLSHNWVRRKDNFEVAICDEAHRFRKSTNMYPHLVSQRPQAEELLEHVRVMVAFLDERQRLRRAEEGTIDYFRQCASAVGVKSENIQGPVKLTAQFRAAGNNAFVEAFDAAMYDGRPTGFSHLNFEVQITDSIEGLETYLQSKIDLGYSARLVAGFCWPWSDPNPDGSLVSDVVVGSWTRPWNRKAEQGRSYTADDHPYTLWANRRADQLGEVGCIYSVQGFEFDYVGVIWPNDLVRRGNRWVAQPAESFDSEMKRGNKATATDIALPLLQNAYRVLSSRGMRGLDIYCLDSETAGYLQESLDDRITHREQDPAALELAGEQ